jgi:hypothetical protein
MNSGLKPHLELPIRTCGCPVKLTAARSGATKAGH